MIISPPFLPNLAAGESDDAWLERAMRQPPYQALHVTALAGSFPVSGSMLWHNGLHIAAPHEDGRYLPVRAVADGKVIHLRPPTPQNSDPAHAQNYTCTGRCEWSDNGCVILEHSTDIGGHAGRPTRLTWYSLTMHLSALDPAVRLGARLYRKDILGQPGSACGCQPMVHFEICLDRPNLTVLLGREPVRDEHEKPRTPTQDGRIDVVFGDLLIYLPAGTPYAVNEPRNAFRDIGHASKLRTAMWVRLHYEKGDALLTCHDLTGKEIGLAMPEPDAEYQLYKTAVDQHANAVRANPGARCSPSGYYELRRFGRNLGPDPLPEYATHWRKVQPENTPIWVDLNGPGTLKLSEGDFPTMCGWGIFDDDTDHGDQRCQSQQLFRWIQDPDPTNLRRSEPDHKPNRLGLPEVQKKMRRAICYFPSEWDQATIEKRFTWIRDPNNVKWPVSQVGWDAFMGHAKAMSMADLPAEYKNAMWRFHPTEFIKTMKRCSWLSEKELMQLVPEKIVRGKGAGLAGPFFYERSLPRAGSLVARYGLELNTMMRKFGIASPKRMAAFVGNSIQEAVWWSSLSEGGGRGLRYAPWYGRGFLQLTNSDGKFSPNSNYGMYLSFRGRKAAGVPLVELTRWMESLGVDAYDATASAGAYWAWMGASNIADKEGRFSHRSIHLDAHSQIYPGKIVGIYEHEIFRKVACTINLPAAVHSNDPKLNGLADRYSAYVVAQLVLMDVPQFPKLDGTMSLIPETFSSRRLQ